MKCHGVLSAQEEPSLEQQMFLWGGGSRNLPARGTETLLKGLASLSKLWCDPGRCTQTEIRRVKQTSCDTSAIFLRALLLLLTCCAAAVRAALSFANILCFMLRGGILKTCSVQCCSHLEGYKSSTIFLNKLAEKRKWWRWLGQGLGC